MYLTLSSSSNTILAHVVSLYHSGAFPLFILAKTLFTTDSVFYSGNFFNSLLAVWGGEEDSSKSGGVNSIDGDNSVSSGRYSFI